MSSHQIKRVVFFLEEESAKDFLQTFIPLHFPALEPTYIHFEGKQHLEKQLVHKLSRWQHSNTQFIVMRDQDAGDCKLIKKKLVNLCLEAKRPDTIVRIACRELESFYLGDWLAVSQAYHVPRVAHLNRESKFRVPDKLSNPSTEIKKLVPEFAKRSGARLIAAHLDPQRNTSSSFQVLYRTLTQLAN